MCSDSRRRLQNPSPSSLLLPTTLSSLKDQVALLTQQIQVLQNQLSAWTTSPAADPPPPPPTTTKLPKITPPNPFTRLQDKLVCFNAEYSLYICLKRTEFPEQTN